MATLVRLRHDAKGRSTSTPADGRFRKRLGPPAGSAWAWFTAEMLESPAFRRLSLAALRSLMRIVLEHMAHAGLENGNLACTYDDFASYGIRRASIARALRDLENAGWVRVTVQGGRCFGAAHRPSRYRLTWLPTAAGDPPSNEWKAIKEIAPDAQTRMARTRKRA